MEEEKTETETPTNDEEVVEETTTEEEETPKTPSEDEVAELKKKADLADNYKIRAEKAESKLKKDKKEEVVTPPQPSNDGLSTKDVLALTEAKVSSEDYDEVVRVAKILDKPVNEAIKDKTLVSILKERVEERTTAAATNTKGGQRGGTKTDGASMLKKAEETGEVPETAEDFTKMAEARIARAKGEK